MAAWQLRDWLRVWGTSSLIVYAFCRLAARLLFCCSNPRAVRACVWLLAVLQPVYWEWDHSLYVYPMPDALVLADSAAAGCFQFDSCSCLNPVSECVCVCVCVRVQRICAPAGPYAGP
jgi:hypothetical protein